MPNPLSAVDCIGPAFSQTKRQLFAPFRLQRWLRLAVVCLMTGDFAGGGAGGPSGNFSSSTPHGRAGRTLVALPHVGWGKILPWLPWILVGVALLFIFVFLWLYFASIYRFVLFDSVLYDRCELKGSWRRWERHGRSFFCWVLGLMLFEFAGLALMVGVPLLAAWQAGLFHHPGEHLLILIPSGIALFFLLLSFFIALAIVALFAKDFCIPIMAMDQVGVLQAWRRLLPVVGSDKLAFAGYVLMKIVLAIGSAIIFGIITIITLLIFLVVLGIVGVVVFFIGKAAGLTLSVTTICVLIVVGGVIATGILYLVALISTPAMVFFQSYVLHFFGSRYPSLREVMFPPPPEPPPTPEAGPPSPFDTPPLTGPSLG